MLTRKRFGKKPELKSLRSKKKRKQRKKKKCLNTCLLKPFKIIKITIWLLTITKTEDHFILRSHMNVNLIQKIQILRHLAD